MTFFTLGGLPEVMPGDDLAALILDDLARDGRHLADDDVVVVCQKVVSKAEGRLVLLDRVEPGPEALSAADPDEDPREVEVVFAESRQMVRVRGSVRIAETRHGFVCANAGVDRSNAPPGTLCLLPEDPDASARRLRERFREAGARVGVVITDTWGRPFRLGAVNTAIGVAGIPALVDYRGQLDAAGRMLRSTTVAFADEIAAATGLLMGKLRRAPVVVARGCPLPDAPGGTGRSLLRDPGEDLFR